MDIMENFPDASQTCNTFLTLLKELEQFADVNPLKIAFDRNGKVYLLGDDFMEEVKANYKLPREVRDAMRDIIARRCGRVFQKDESTVDQPDIN